MANLGTLYFDTRLNAQAVQDADTIKKQVLHKLGNSIPLKLKVTFTSKDLRSDLQAQLSKFRPKAKVDIIVDQVTASKAVQDALAKAGLMNNATAGQLRAQKIAEIQQRMALALAKAQRQAANAADKHSKSILTLNSHFGNGITLGGRFSSTIASIYSVYTLKNFIQSMIQIGGEFQKQRIALETMLGSLAKADAMYERMKELAVESPFTFMDLMSYTKQLKAFQVPYNELFETTKRLGDISAGLGVDMNRLILAFGQVRAAAFLRGQEVRQFTEAGIPLVDALAKKFSELEKRAVSAGDVFDKISKRQVSFGMVKDVLWELTDEGGQFYNMQAKLTESLSGKLDKLRDSYQIMIAEMAQGNNNVLGAMLDIMTGLVKYGDVFVGVLGSLTTGFIIYKTVVMAWNAWANRAIITQRLLNAAMSANWVAIGLGAIATAIGLYKSLSDAQDTTAKSIRELRAEIQQEFEAMDETESKGQELIRTMFSQNKTIETQREAYRRLQEIYPDMFKNMDFEQAKRKSNIELLHMETQAARDAMKAKLDARIADARSRKAEAKKLYEQYNPQSDTMKALGDTIIAKGGEKAVKDFKEKAQQSAAEYEAVSEELDELIQVQKDFDRRVETAKANRSSKWWQKAKELAGSLTMYAPKEDQDFEDYFEAIEKNLNSRKGLLDKMTEQSENYAQIKEEVDTLKGIWENALGGRTESLSKFKAKGSQKDPLLEEYKLRLDSLEKFMQAYERYAKEYSKADAIRFAEELFPDFKGQGSKVVDDYRNFLLELTRISGSDDRKKFVNLVMGKISAIDTDALKKKVDNAMKQLDRYVKEQANKYDLYKKILDATGDRQKASTIAFGNLISYDNFADELRDKIQDAISKMDKAKGLSIEQLLGMDDQELNEIGIFEKSLDGVYKMLQKLRDEEQKLKAEDVDLFIEAINNAKSLDTELAQIELKYNRSRKAIMSKGGDQSLIDNTFKNEAADKSKARWEWFKKTNEDWGRIFSNLDDISTRTLQHMMDKLEEQLPFIDDNVEAVKELYQALEKLNDELKGRSPFSTIFNSIQQGSRLRQLYKSLNGGSYTATSEKYAKYYGLQQGKAYTSNEIKDLIKKAGSDFVSGLEGLSAGFKAVQDVLSPVVNLFEQLGDSSLANLFGMGSNALGAAAQVAGGLNALGLEAAGPWGAAAGAALSVISSVVAMHDESLQKEIEASKARQKEMENLTKNLETSLERALGGIYNTKAGNNVLDSLAKEIANPFKGLNMKGVFGGLFDTDSDYRSYIGKDTIKAVENAKKTKSYYDATYASLLAQRDEVQHQMESEKDKKDSDSEKIADYKQQLIEMEDEIENFAKDMAKNLWDIDVKSWAKTLTDTIVDAWKKGENAVDAYKNKVKEMMLDLTTSILSQKVMEEMLDKVNIDALITELMSSTMGELDTDSVAMIADKLNEVGVGSAEVITSILDEMERKGYISKDEEEKSSTASSSIKGITEQKADLLASYVNAIRADVSIIRGTQVIYLPSIATAVQHTSAMADIQVMNLQQIADNTRRNADAADKIYDIMHKIDTGVTAIKMK